MKHVVDAIRERECKSDASVAGRPAGTLADRAADPYADNPRLHTEADLDKIAASILKWGWTMPVLVDEKGMLIAGEGA